ncbi:MAG: hypothetical protein GX540_07575 [Clostridiales bacterium]|nr:hypothetical protein [Clostridiales bacterium]
MFHLRGGMDHSALGFVHKAIMWMLKKVLSRKDPATLRAEDRELLDTYGQMADFKDKTTIVPILAYVQDEG